ncbi:glycosyltransferase family 4 protein [Leucobacter sp.]
MRVLAVTPWFPTPSAPGSGIFNLRDVELLARDHRVAVLHLHDPALPDGPAQWRTDDGVTVHRGLFSSSRPGTWRAAIREIRRHAVGADLVHTMAFPAILPVALAGPHRPWVHTEHWSGLVGTPATLRARLGGAVLRPGLRRPDAMVAVGRPLADAVDRFRSEPTAVIGNRVRLAPADAAERGQLPQRPEERGDGPLRLVGVGNLIPWKGVLETIDAVAELRNRGVDARLEWAGSGPLADEARSHATALGIAERVSLLGHVDPEALPETLRRAHLFVLPTRGETFGVAVAEALGHGLPVVTSGEGGHRAFLPPAASRAVETRSGTALAAAIAELASDPERWTPDEIAGYARETFSEERRRADYREVYDRAVQRASKRQR